MSGKIIKIDENQPSKIFDGVSRITHRIMPPIHEHASGHNAAYAERQAKLDAWADVIEPETPKL